jgi:hypothetical protein
MLEKKRIKRTICLAINQKSQPSKAGFSDIWTAVNEGV